MNKKNYQKIMEDLIRENCTAGEAPSLLLHSCCAPCSSYCIACLAEHFHVTVFYTIPIFIRRKNIICGQRSRNVLLLSFLQNIRFLLWKVHTIHSGFTIWQRAWKRSRKGESAVLPVTGCGFLRLRPMQKRTDLISLRQHYPSVR